MISPNSTNDNPVKISPLRFSPRNRYVSHKSLVSAAIKRQANKYLHESEFREATDQPYPLDEGDYEDAYEDLVKDMQGKRDDHISQENLTNEAASSSDSLLSSSEDSRFRHPDDEIISPVKINRAKNPKNFAYRLPLQKISRIGGSLITFSAGGAFVGGIAGLPGAITGAFIGGLVGLTLNRKKKTYN